MVGSIIAILALLTLIGSLGIEILAARQSASARSPANTTLFVRLLPWGALGLIIGNLIWLAFECRHIPPVGLAESSIVVAGVSIGLYLWLKKLYSTAPWFFSLGLLLTSVIFLYGVIQLWIETSIAGQPPLWLWGVLARWLILGGISGLLWLAALAATTWRIGFIARSANGASDMAAGENAIIADKRWQPLCLVVILVGGMFYVGRAWWGWGQPNDSGLAVSVVVILMLAAAWLRFTWPQRQWWTWSLTIMAFIAALPMLVSIAS